MAYYEELGVSAEAEIRNSYRTLNRMLPPDTQPNAKLRKFGGQITI